MTFSVKVRRANGRLVKSQEGLSKYAAKKLADKWDGKYDQSYQIEIVPHP